MKGVICTDKASFDAWWETIVGRKDPETYRQLRDVIAARCRKFGWDREKPAELLSRLCIMTYEKAVANGGWRTRNHVSYLISCAFNELCGEGKAAKRISGWDEYVEVFQAFPCASKHDNTNAFEVGHDFQKALHHLRKKNSRHADIIEVMLGGMSENEDLAIHFNMSNAAFRKAKERAFTAFREVWDILHGRDPGGDGPTGRRNGGHMPSKPAKYDNINKNMPDNETSIRTEYHPLLELNRSIKIELNSNTDSFSNKGIAWVGSLWLNGLLPDGDARLTGRPGSCRSHGVMHADILTTASREARTSLSWPRVAA